MMKATKIHMKRGCEHVADVREIAQIYLEDGMRQGWCDKEDVHDFLKQRARAIYVNIWPYPKLLPATSVRGEKYVRSEPNDTPNDNLLQLPHV